MTAENFSRPGAIDLSALGRPAGSATAPPPAAGVAGTARPPGGSYSFDVTEQEFQARVIEASMRHPVLLALWSARAPKSREAVEALSRVADTFDGRVSLARLDIDASPQLSQALQVRAVPYVLAVLRGQPVPLFEGSVDDDGARQAIDQVVQAAVANGITGLAEPVGTAPDGGGATDQPAEPSEPSLVAEEPVDPRFADAEAALDRGDAAAAVEEYRRLVEATPADAEASRRLAQAELVLRTTGADLATAREAAAARPDDADAQLLVADLDLIGGHVDDAFDRVIELVRRSAGDERERARRHLLGLFEVVGTDDAQVAAARRRLASALF